MEHNAHKHLQKVNTEAVEFSLLQGLHSHTTQHWKQKKCSSFSQQRWPASVHQVSASVYEILSPEDGKDDFKTCIGAASAHFLCPLTCSDVTHLLYIDGDTLGNWEFCSDLMIFIYFYNTWGCFWSCDVNLKLSKEHFVSNCCNFGNSSLILDIVGSYILTLLLHLIIRALRHY